MKKKVSFKSISNESSEMEPILLSINDIDKTEIFDNNSEIIIKNILEKIIINVFAKIKSKEIDCLVERRCSDYCIQEINSLISQNYICYEKENYFLTESKFMDNYLREEPPWDECQLTQPTPGKMDRWKIHRMEVRNLRYRNRSQISEISEGPSMIYDKKTLKGFNVNNIKLTKLAKKLREEKEKEKEREKEEAEKIKNRKMGIRDMDTFPSYPLSDELFKININISKEDEEQIELYRAEQEKKDEKKKKENEKKEMIEKLKNKSQMKSDEMELEEKMKNNKNRYRGKTIGVTTNGEIIFIQNVNIDNLKSDFLEINTKMKNLRNPTTHKINNVGQKNNSIDIEKNVNDEANLDFFKINNKEKMAQQIITGGSSFKNFVPEIGVNLKQNGNIKSGGTDFLNKFKKISVDQFQKTLEIFKRTNHANNEIVDMKNESKSRNNNNINSSINNNSNILSSTNLNNNNNTNYNYINQHSLVKSSSLPEINHMNSKTIETSNILNPNNNMMNMMVNNDSNIKNSFYFTNYNNSNLMNSTKYNIMNNFIKTSSSFKNLFLKEENPFYKQEDVIPDYTTKQFFKIFNPKIKKVSKLNKNKNISLTKIQDFNKNILKNNNWGEVMNGETRNKYRGKPFINNVKKNFFNKTMSDNFRVRKNGNENYHKKMLMFNKISLRSQSTENIV